MLTPTRGIAPDRSLLAVGAQILMELESPLTVSQAWSRTKLRRKKLGHHSPVSFGWFVLALDTLHALGAVDMHDDLLVRRRGDAPRSER